MNYEDRKKIKAAVDQAARAKVGHDGLGRRIRTLAQHQNEVARQGLAKRKYGDHQTQLKMARHHLSWVDADHAEVKCTLCGRVSSKYANPQYQHEEDCRVYGQADRGIKKLYEAERFTEGETLSDGSSVDGSGDHHRDKGNGGRVGADASAPTSGDDLSLGDLTEGSGASGSGV